MKGNDYSIIKAANRTLIYNTLLTMGPMSIMEVLYETRLSRPTVENTVRDMISDGLIEKAGISKLSVGRSAQLYQIGTHTLFAMGVDLEFPAIRLAILNLQGERQYVDIWQCDPDAPANEIIEQLISHMKAAVAQVVGDGNSQQQLIGIGIGIGGLLDLQQGVSLSHERIREWKNIPLSKLLKKEFNVHVTVRNDVHMLAFIHRSDRIKQGISNYNYISLRSGIGMVSYINGDMYSGAMGNAGFFGHTSVDFNGPPCRCGSRGCLEGYMSAARLLQQYTEQTGKTIDYDTLLTLCAENEPVTTRILCDAYHLFGKAIANTIKIMDIENVVINGLPERVKALLLQWVKEGIASCLDERVNQHVNVCDETLSEEEKPMGAALLMLQRFINTPKLRLAPKQTV